MNTRALCGSIRVVAIAVSVWLAAPVVKAAGLVPCEQPMVFESAAVNALVLPYRYDGTDQNARADLVATGERLSALAQMEVLLSMLKYESIGVVRLSTEGNRICDVGEIINRVTRGPGGIRPGNGLVLIWGRIYVEGDVIYLQSYLRFLRPGTPESIEVTLPGAEDVPLKFGARLPVQALAFEPRVIGRSDLSNIESTANKTLVLRDQPDTKSFGKPLDIHPQSPFTYSVIESRSDWVRIQSRTGGASGWVQARADNDGWALRRFLPELGYLDAVAGYLRLSATQSPPFRNADGAREWIAQEFRAYESAVGADEAPVALGLARALQGFMLWNFPSKESLGSRRQAAALLFVESQSFTPHLAEARNLTAVTAPFLAEGARANLRSVQSRRAFGEALLGALAVDGGNRTALGNLETLYTAASKDSGEPLFADVAARLELVRTVRNRR